MGETKIDWCDVVWNPVTGCTKVSEGCRNCYAERMARRLAGRCGYPEGDGFAVACHEDRLKIPFTWRKPKRVFVNSMGDLFHEDVQDAFIDMVWEVMEKTPEHTYLILTKRPYRMSLYTKPNNSPPLPNVWLGVTAENQTELDRRVPWMLQCRASVRFVSVEPMLGSVTFVNANLRTGRLDGVDPETGFIKLQGLKNNFLTGEHFEDRGGCTWHRNAVLEKVDWVICGGESGRGARAIRPEWVRLLRDQCANYGVPFFFKQWGDKPAESCFQERGGLLNARMNLKKCGHILDGREWREFPKAIDNGQLTMDNGEEEGGMEV